MKNKKFALLALLVALVMVFAVVLTACQDHKCTSECPECGKCTNKDCKEEACKDKCNGHDEGPSYIGLFTYTRDADGVMYYGDLVLFEDGSFWYENDMLANNYLGTYEYNSDKTKITLVGENLPDVDGTYDVEVNADGKVVIKQIFVLSVGGVDYKDDFIYNELRPHPQKQPITIKTFYQVEDETSYLELQTEGKYLLMVNVVDPAIISSGTYTTSEANGVTTVALTDTLNGNNATYTFTYKYSEADGYSEMLLKGTGLDANGIAFSDSKPSEEKEVLQSYKGTATSEAFGENYEEIVILRYFSETEVELEFTIMNGNDYGTTNVVAGKATVAFPSITFTWDDSNPAASCIESVVGTISMEDFSVTIEVKISVESMSMSYEATLTEVAAEREPMMVYTGTVQSDAFGAKYDEAVTIKFYSETEVEIEFTIMGAVGGTNVVAGTAETVYPNIVFTWDAENLATSCIESCVATIGADFSVTIEVTISTANIPGFSYTVTLTMVA